MRLKRLSLRISRYPARLKAACLALACCLVAGAVQAADTGPRHHAQGQYDAPTGTYVVVSGDDLTGISGFINGESISRDPLGLRIAVGNVCCISRA